MVETAKNESQSVLQGPRSLGVDIRNKDGNVVGHVDYGEGGIRGEGETVYKTSSGSWSTDIYKSGTFSYDAGTGKINIVAPQEVLDSDWFKNAYTNNNTFRQVASMFAINPNDKTGYAFTDKDGKTAEKTIEDYLKEQQEAFNEYYKSYVEDLLPRKRNLSTLTDGQSFSDNQVIISASATSRDKNKFSKDVVVYLPNVALGQAPELMNLDSWNADTQTVNAEDFYKWYTLNENPKDMSDKLKTINSILDETILMQAQKKDMSEYDKDELARLISFRNTLKSDKPDSNIFISVGMATNAAANAFLDNLTEAGFSLTSFLETAFATMGEAYNINTTTGKIAAVLTGGMSVNIGTMSTLEATLIQGGAIASDDLGDIIAGVDNNPSETEGIDGMIAFGDIVNGLANGNIKETLEKWAKATDTPLNAEALASVQEIYNEKMDALESLSGAASLGKVVGNLAAEIVKQIVLTNVVGGAVGSVVKGGVKGATAALETGLKAYTGAMGAKQLAAVLKAANASAGFIGFASNILAQGIVDTVLNDEASLEKMLSEGDTSDAFKAVYKNSVYNLFGELTGLGTEKAVTKFKASKLGHRVQTASWRAANQAAGVKHTILGNFANWVADGSGRVSRFLDTFLKASDDTSRWYAALHWQEAEAAFNIATAAKGLSGEEAYQATRKAVIDKMDLEVQMGKVTRGTMQRFNEIVTNEAISKEYEEFQDTYAALLKEEGAKSVKIGEGTFLSQDTATYIARLSKVKYLENKLGEDVTSVIRKAMETPGFTATTFGKTEADYYVMLQARIKAFESTHSEALVTKAQELLLSIEKYEYAYMNFAKLSYDEGGLGLYNVEQVQGWRDTGFWGEDGKQYVPLVRVEGDEGAISAAKRSLADWEEGGNYQAKLSVDEYSYKPGDADAEYLDPSLTIYTQQVTAAKVANARDWGATLMKNDPFIKEIDADGNYVTKTELKRAKSEIRRSVSDVMEDYKVNMDILNYDLAGTYKTGTKSSVGRARTQVKRVLGLTDQKAYNRAVYDLDLEDLNALRTAGVNVPIVNEMTTKSELQAYYDGLKKSQKNIVDKALGTKKLTVKNFNEALKTTDLQTNLQRSFLHSDSSALQSSAYKNYIEQMKAKALDATRKTQLTEAEKKFDEATKQLKLRTKGKGKDAFTKQLSALYNDMSNRVVKTLKENAFFNNVVDEFVKAGVPEEVAEKYIVASSFNGYFSGVGSTRVFKDMINSNLSNISVSGNLSNKARITYGKAIEDGMKGIVSSEYGASVKAVQAAGGNSVLDADEVYNYIYKQMSDFIDTTIKSPNVVQVLDADGKFHLYEVSPSTATVYNTRPNPYEYKQKGFTKFFNKTNRLARLGNVGYSLKSFTNQWVRDPLNAYVMGGFVRTIGQRADALGDLLGPSAVQVLKESMGEAGWKSFTEDLASTLGREATQEELETVAKEAVNSSSYLKDMATEALGGTETEMAFYRRQATGTRDLVWGQFEQERSAMEKTFEWLERHSIGETREIYLRKAVFANSYSDAIELGHTTHEAKIIAEYTMQNATTNFSRSFAWGNRITNSVSFLGAAINGRASFWRLLEVDPVGVSMRFINGLAIPTMALVSQSLQSETDREVYESIPEYEKEDNLVFVVNGQKMKIPIPQELSAFIAPFRQAVEKAHGANKHAWGELIANDILGTSAIDLKGFVVLDKNLLEGDVTFADRLSSEARTLVSQLSPTVIKTAYMAITGVDPYTGNPIDTNSVRLDNNMELQIYDSKSSAFTTWLSKTLKSMGIELSGSAAHALIKSMLGNGFSNVIDSVSDLFDTGKFTSLLETPLKDVTSAFVPSSSNDTAQYAWNQVVKELKQEKARLLASNGELTKVSNSLSMLDSSAADYEEKRQTLLKQYYQLTEDYQQKVYTAVKNLQEKYGAEYDRSKFAATISLLNFYVPTGDNVLEYEKQLSNKQYQAARSQAIRTMVKYGFDSPSDLSIFGYLKTNEYGETEAKAFDPVAILNQSSEVWGAKNIDAANIATELEQANLTRKEMFGDEYKKAKAAGKAAYKKYKNDWNTKVVKALAPYIQSRGVKNVVGDRTTRDLLDEYLFDVNQYQAEQYLTKIFGGK